MTLLILLLRCTTIDGNATESVRGAAFLACAYLVMRRFIRSPRRFRGRIRIRPRARLRELAPIALLLAFATSNYLGLRTAGTFTMFSNLRTEGAASNHWILAGNPLKAFGYQDDLVEVLAFPDAVPAIWRGMVRAGNSAGGQRIPLVQFRSLMYLARTNMGMRSLGPVRLRHAGVVHELDDVMASEFFAPARRSWEMRLMAFRQVVAFGVEERFPKGLCMW